MKSLQIHNGDIVLAAGGGLSFVRGSRKLVQDLSIWMREPVGSSPLVPRFGSLLPDMIGSASVELSLTAVNAEVRRILELYQADQQRRLQDAKRVGNLANWTRSEIIDEVIDIQSQIVQDSIQVIIRLRTLVGEEDVVELRL